MATTVYCAAGLKLHLDEKAEETIVSCQGMITEETAEIFQREVSGRTIPDSRGKGVAANCRIVLDLSKVTHIDNEGLGALLAVWTAGQQKSCSVEVVNLGASANKLPAVARLDQLFRKMLTLFA